MGSLEKQMAGYLQRNINMDILEMKVALLLGKSRGLGVFLCDERGKSPPGTQKRAGANSALRKALGNKAIADLRPLRFTWFTCTLLYASSLFLMSLVTDTYGNSFGTHLEPWSKYLEQNCIDSRGATSYVSSMARQAWTAATKITCPGG